jgi:hypothetical protein
VQHNVKDHAGVVFTSVWATWGERGEATLDSGLTYGPDGPVLVHAGKRLGRYLFSDLGRAVAAAGRPRGWREAAARVADEHVVNISRSGVVSLPAVEARDRAWIVSLPGRVARASVALYEALLDLE